LQPRTTSDIFYRQAEFLWVSRSDAVDIFSQTNCRLSSHKADNDTSSCQTDNKHCGLLGQQLAPKTSYFPDRNSQVRCFTIR